MNDETGCVVRSLACSLHLPSSLLLFLLNIHPDGFVKENLSSKNSTAPKRDSARADWRKMSGPLEASQPVFKQIKKPPNYSARDDFHKKAPDITHNTLFISLAQKEPCTSQLTAFISDLLSFTFLHFLLLL